VGLGIWWRRQEQFYSPYPHGDAATVNRTGNSVAHGLAKLAVHHVTNLLWREEISDSIRDVILFIAPMLTF
jgi:hypothetical protein